MLLFAEEVEEEANLNRFSAFYRRNMRSTLGFDLWWFLFLSSAGTCNFFLLKSVIMRIDINLYSVTVHSCVLLIHPLVSDPFSFSFLLSCIQDTVEPSFSGKRSATSATSRFYICFYRRLFVCTNGAQPVGPLVHQTLCPLSVIC
jgi:hypothetical protein